MIKNKRYLNFLLILTLALSLFPLLSSAQNQFLPTGPGCNPGLIPDDSDMPDFVVCPYLDENGSTKLRLTWELNDKTFENPVCLVGCNRLDGGSCAGASQGDGQGLGTSTLDVSKWNLGPKDEIVLSGSDIREGNIYQIGCMPRPEAWGKVTKGLKGVCSEPDSCMGSTKAKIVDTGSCEIPFDQIISSLNSFKVTNISEKNPKEWSSNDTRDEASKGGSGNGKDLDTVLSKISSDYIKEIRETLKTDTDFVWEISDLVSLLKKEFAYGVKDINNIFKENTNKVIPAGLIGFNSESEIQSVLITPTIITNLQIEDDNLSFSFMYGDSFVEITCLEKKFPFSSRLMLSAYSLPTNYYECSPRGAGYSLLLVLPKKGGANPFSRLMAQLGNQMVNNQDWLKRPENRLFPSSSSKPVDFSVNVRAGGGEMSFPFTAMDTFGPVDFNVKTNYFGNFDSSGRDCHPDGSFSLDKRTNLFSRIYQNFQKLSVAPEVLIGALRGLANF